MSDTNFALEEYKTLHTELNQHVQETLALERYAIAGIAAVFSWLASRKTGATPLPEWVWFVPILLPLAGGLRCLALYKYIGLIAEYLGRLEKELGPTRPADMGWEKFLEPRRRPIRGAIAWLIWLILLTATETFAIWQVRPSFCASLGIVGTTMLVCIVGVILIWLGTRRANESGNRTNSSNGPAMPAAEP